MKFSVWFLSLAFLAACGGATTESSDTEVAETEGGEVEPAAVTPEPAADPDKIDRGPFTKRVADLLTPQVCSTEKHPVRICFGAEADECNSKFSAAVLACESVLPAQITQAQAQEAAFALGQCAGAKYGEQMDADGRRKDLPECKQTREGFVTEVKKVLPAQVCGDAQQPPRACFTVTEQECVDGFSAALDACADQVPETFVPEKNQEQLQVLGQCAATKYKETLEPKKRPCGPSGGPTLAP